MQRQIEKWANKTFDLLVLGGGITGAGVALDAVLRGLNVALIDKGDFASGTSSVSSKLIHGGLRYLEQGNFRLVYEGLHERSRLLQNAPHLVHPLRFVSPFYKNDRIPPWKGRLGLTLYDFLAGKGVLHRSTTLSASSLTRKYPLFATKNLLGGVEYFDAQMDDARLCLEVLQTADRIGACVANYAEAKNVETAATGLYQTACLDGLSGRQFSIAARQVVNATGPWVDQVRQSAGDGNGLQLQPTKGVHLIVERVYAGSAFLLLHPRDGRVIFVIPWQGKTLLGTTDTAFEGKPEHASVDANDINYLLEGFNHFFEGKLGHEDIRGQFVGVRPLLRANGKDPSSLSREFRLWTSPNGMISVAGGKFTTYRAMAEKVVDHVVKNLGLRRRCRTRTFPLDGVPQEPWLDFSRRTVRDLAKSIDPAIAHHLVHRYGRRALDVAKLIANHPRLAEKIAPGEPDIWAEIAYQRNCEMAVASADHFLRRTHLALTHPGLLNLGEKDIVPALAALMTA